MSSTNANAPLAKGRSDDAGTSAITVLPASQRTQPFECVSEPRPISNLKWGRGHMMVTAGRWP